MTTKPLNIKLEFLHRDEGNYKIFGSIIFRNPDGICLEETNKIVKEKLIDREYFYPQDVNIQLFEEHKRIGSYFSDWYEFDQFSATKEKPTDKRSLKEFIQTFKES